MTVPAIGPGMGAMKSESGSVRESRDVPTGGHRLVALLAIGRKPGEDVIGIVGFPEIRIMAPLAVDRRSRKFVLLLVDMAGGAVGNGVYAHQGETARSVKIDNVLLILPA